APTTKRRQTQAKNYCARKRRDAAIHGRGEEPSGHVRPPGSTENGTSPSGWQCLIESRRQQREFDLRELCPAWGSNDAHLRYHSKKDRVLEYQYLHGGNERRS